MVGVWNWGAGLYSNTLKQQGQQQVWDMGFVETTVTTLVLIKVFENKLPKKTQFHAKFVKDIKTFDR